MLVGEVQGSRCKVQGAGCKVVTPVKYAPEKQGKHISKGALGCHCVESTGEAKNVKKLSADYRD
jgi:hypothetical protein